MTKAWAGADLLQFDTVRLSRFLRKDVLDPFVLGFKLLLGGICAAALIYAISQIIEVSLEAESAATKLRQSVIEASERVKQPGTTGPRRGSYGAIAERNILGAVSQPQAPTQTTAAPQPAKTDLILIGTYIDGDLPPFAIIEDKKKNVQEVFAIGESIFDDAKLVAVRADAVDIMRGSERSTLSLDDAPDSAGGSAGVSGDGTSFVVDEAELDKALENLPLLLTQARAVPYFRDGKATGLRLFAIRNGSMFEKLGLKNGDILKSINGNSLADLSQAMQLFEQLKSERSINIVLERSNEEKEFRYEIR